MATSLASVIGRNIASVRKQRGLTQAAVAEQIDVDAETVSRFERGAVMPGVATLERLCAVLECSWMDLLEGSSGDAQQVAHDIVRLLEPLAGDDRLFLLEQMKVWTSKLLERCPPARRRNRSSGAS
ncbi:helix-turn-helix domain-containing protein [Trinickia fusca]|uniref:XRE family transcriptional regulator n=1 Tax=Trinickia fusca TaxID=2419777 RepID=A0A494XBS4_9BURK|nr:helix-turn-helix transcriptional regulator [Trinickia fusca]RKP48287.1 XRE family transcriptional regulator [Trinickia fusca]